MTRLQSMHVYHAIMAAYLASGRTQQGLAIWFRETDDGLVASRGVHPWRVASRHQSRVPDGGFAFYAKLSQLYNTSNQHQKKNFHSRENRSKLS